MISRRSLRYMLYCIGGSVLGSCAIAAVSISYRHSVFGFCGPDKEATACSVIVKRLYSCRRCIEDPMCLASLTHSGNWETRHLAIRALEYFTSLPEWQKQVLAQSCSSSGLAALARSNNPSIPLALKPIPIKLEVTSLETRLREIISELLKTTDDSCARFYAQRSMNDELVTARDEREQAWDESEHSLETAFRNTLRRMWIYPEQWLLYLEALEAISMEREQLERMLKLGVMSLLDGLWDIYSIDDDYRTRIHMLILKILGNISSFGASHHILVRTGWLQRLNAASSSKRLELQLLARKILANLDPDKWGSVYQDGVYLLHPKTNTTEEPEADLIFVHGLIGGVFKSWRQRDVYENGWRNHVPNSVQETRAKQPYTRCWPQDWLPDEFPNIRIIAVDFASFLSNWGLCPDLPRRTTLEARSVEFEEKLKAIGVGKRPIIWITHSMGGLIVKRILCRNALDIEEKSSNEDSCSCGTSSAGMLKNTSGIVFYATPHLGSPVATRYTATGVRHVALISTDVDELQEGSVYLKDLHVDFKNVMNTYNIPSLSFVESQGLPPRYGVRFANFVVPEYSSDPSLGRYYRLRCHHFNTCKPESKESASYAILVDFIREILDAQRHDCDFLSSKAFPPR